MTRPRSAAAAGPRAGGALDAALLALLLLPNLVWILLDARLWTSDEAWYALWSLRVAEAAQAGPAAWLEKLFLVRPKPPLLPWLGQLAVPLGRAFGSIDRALLGVSFLASIAAVLFVYGALRALCRDRAAAWIGGLALASSPALVAASKSFFVQTLQTAAIAWLVFAMAHARRWDAARTLLHVAAAGSAALLTQLSSPAFAALPVLAALFEAARALRRSGVALELRRLPLLAVALALAGAAGVWFLRHFQDASAYGGWSYRYFFGGGLAQDYAVKLAGWVSLLFGAAGLGSLGLVLLGALLVWALLPRAAPTGRGPLFAVALLAQIFFPLALFASSAHQTYRYVLPLVVYLALLVGWSLARVGRAWPKALVAAFFAVQLVGVQLGQFGLAARHRSIDDVGPLQAAADRSRELAGALARATADAPPESPIYLATGVLGLYNLNVQLEAALADAGRVREGPHLRSVEFRLTGSFREGVGQDVDAVWDEILAARPAYVVLVSEAVRREHGRSDEHGWGVIVRGTDAVAARVVASGQFERVAARDLEPELELWRPRAAPTGAPGGP